MRSTVMAIVAGTRIRPSGRGCRDGARHSSNLEHEQSTDDGQHPRPGVERHRLDLVVSGAPR